MKTKAFKLYLIAAITVLTLSMKSSGGASRVEKESGDSLKLSKEQLLKFCGEYLPIGDDPRMQSMSVHLYKDVLYRHVNNDYVALNPVSPLKFVYDDSSGRSFEFISDKKGVITEVIVTRPDGKFKFRKNTSAPLIQPVTVTKPVAEEVAQLLQKYADYGQFNGSVLLAKDGKLIYQNAFGMANIELGVPNTLSTKYRLASVSKQFTAMLAMQLVEQGKLDLQAPISTYLPKYPKAQGQKITAHHLLNHSSGIPNFTSFNDYQSRIMRNPHTPEELVKLFDTLPLEFEPGARFSYSNSGYVLLGYLIETLSGKSYESCLRDQIFGPLNMNNSGLDHTELILPQRAAGYDKMGNKLVNAGYIDMSVPFSAGALYSTVEDLYLWDQALNSDKLLSPKYKELMFKNYHEGKAGSYGYGWGVSTLTSNRNKQTLKLLEHSGGIQGFNTFISRIPDDKYVLILLGNLNGASLGEISYAIRAIAYDRPFDQPKKSLAYTMADLVRTQGLNTALSKFSEMKSSGMYKLNEGEMNEVGYDFLQAKQFNEAIAIFKLNVDAYPNSGNCYDSLGEAYLKNGDKELAIKNYKRSVELDPKNENGKKILADLTK